MKRVIATAAVAASLLGIFGAPASANEPPAYGVECGFGEVHANRAMAGELGNDGHKPGSHKGASTKDCFPGGN